jgi:hypothetical protein
MNGRSHQGLSESGLIAQIANAVMLWKEDPVTVTENDCKLVIALTIREYQKLVYPANCPLPATPAARKDLLAGKGAIREHVIPVGCVQNTLMHFVELGNVLKAREKVREILYSSTVLAWVSIGEHHKLCADRMPESWSHYPWENVWARYKDAGIDIPCEPLLTRLKT